MEQDTPMHALSVLGSHHNKRGEEQKHGRILEHEAEGVKYSGTYSKPC